MSLDWSLDTCSLRDMKSRRKKVATYGSDCIFWKPVTSVRDESEARTSGVVTLSSQPAVPHIMP